MGRLGGDDHEQQHAARSIRTCSTNMYAMFNGADAPIGEWDVSAVTDMRLMFSGARRSTRTSGGGTSRR